MRLEVDPVRLRALRTRLELPLEAAAKIAGVDAAEIERLESAPQTVELDVLRRLAKAYRRNWYVFLLEDEPGRPALPRDFRTLARGRDLSAQTLAAFDDAEFLIAKILDLPRSGPPPRRSLPSIRGIDPETAAHRIREAMGASLDAQRAQAGEYDAMRYWSTLVAQAGVYAAQLSFPYREVRAVCLVDSGVTLIVVSSQDSPRARTFSLLHELGHLLLGGDAMCRPRSDDHRAVAGNEEAYCNAFAAAMLMPGQEFADDPLALSLRGKRLELGDALDLARKYGVSELAVLRRLTTVGYLSEAEYQRLHNERAEEFADEPRPTDAVRIRKQATRMINENSRLFASEVLDAHARGDISFRENRRLARGQPQTRRCRQGGPPAVKRQTGLFRKYALDSSFFIDLFTRDGSHPRDRYVGLWEHFEGQVDRGEIIAPMEVREELTNNVDPELDRWLVEHRSIFVEISRPQLDILQRIVRAYPAFTRGKENMADPAVVALAAAEGLTVLTSERRQQYASARLPKIPNLCDEHRVPCLGVNDYLRAEAVVLR